MKKLTKLTGILAALTLAFALVACSEPSDSTPKEQLGLLAGKSLKAIEGFDHVYTVEYDGEYYLEDAISSNLISANDLVAYLNKKMISWKIAAENNKKLTIELPSIACCSIAANNAGEAGGKIFGRNYDYDNGTAIILHTMPYNGYESVSTSYPYFVTGELWWEPSYNFMTDAVALGLIYAPLDGMNEKGLYISILQLDDEETNQADEGKNDVQTTVAVRYILDNAATVAEALEILEGFNMHNVFDTAYHYAIADATRSVVVEYINNKMLVKDAKVVTNHYLTDTEAKPYASTNSTKRYNAAYNAGEAAEWNMTPEQMRDALKAAKCIHDPDDDSFVSIWSAVFEPNAKRITYYFREDYTKSAVITFGN